MKTIKMSVDESEMDEMNEQLRFILDIEQFEQRSPEWFQQRRNKLTSSDAGTVLGLNPYKSRKQLLFEKCGKEVEFKGNEYTLHGQKYEDEAIQKYCEILDKQNYNVGMISFKDIDKIRENKESKIYIDDKYHFLGGSADGIAVDKKTNQLIMLEVKCPFRRKIIYGKIPDYYYPQVQLNLFILDLEIADFIEYIPESDEKYLSMNIVRVYKNHDWFKKNFDVLEEFWKDVERWRKEGIENHPEWKE